jgi:signal transduction histidine kinase
LSKSDRNPQSSTASVGGWSIAGRFFLTSFVLIVAQSGLSLAISGKLWRDFTSIYLDSVLSRQVLTPLNLVNNKLDLLTAKEAMGCCKRENYKDFLSEIVLDDGKAVMISGSAGLVPGQGAENLYTSQQLSDFAELATSNVSRFALVDYGTDRAVAVKSVNLSGGSETGALIYIRPIYSMSLFITLSRIRFLSEIGLMLSLVVLLAVALTYILRPIRSVRSRLSNIQLDNLDTALIPLNGQPVELQPILTEFNRMVRRLEVSAKNQKQFASTISHEFRTPLTVISGFIQSVLNRAEDLQPRYRDSLQVADQEAFRLNRMLSDLLDLSRADNHQLKILNEPFPVQLSCYQTLKLARAAYTNKISDNLDSTEEVFAVGDPDRLVQCLENLIGNAVKYSDLDTPIALEVRTNPEYIEVSIIDSGQGIPADEQDLIFERFKRAGGVVLRKGQTSSGLGLSIVKMLVEGMGGEIFVLSEVGNGSKFTIKLPRFNSGL